MRFMLRNVRLAFPQLWKASAPKGGGEPAFSASFIFPPDHKQIIDPSKPNQKVVLADHLNKVVFSSLAVAKWGKDADKFLRQMTVTKKLCLQDGDGKAEYEGYEGNLFVSSRSKVRPSVWDQQRNELTQEDGKPYSGCYVNASLEFWAQDNDFGKRINAQLRGVQFYADGDAFAGGGSAAAQDDFEEIAAPDEEEDDLTK